MPQCVGRQCGEKVQVQGAVTRYTAAQCKRACENGSNLCGLCRGHEEADMSGQPIAKSKWHGRVGGPLPSASHIEGSKWNAVMREKEAARAAKAAVVEASSEVKAAAASAKAAKAAAEREERELMAALRREEVALRREEVSTKKAATAAIRAAKAPDARRTLKKPVRSSSSSSSGSSSGSSSSRRRSRRSSSSRRRPRSSSPSRSRPRSSSSMRIYRPASAASAAPTYSERWGRVTPISENKQVPNPNRLQAIGESLVGLPELK